MNNLNLNIQDNTNSDIDSYHDLDDNSESNINEASYHFLSDDQNIENSEDETSEENLTFVNEVNQTNQNILVSTNQDIQSQFNSDLIAAQNESLNNYYKDMSYIQPNLASQYKKFDHDLTYVFKMVPLTFFIDYNDKKIYEYSQKIIAPKSLLLNISEYEDLSFPIYLKINDSEKILGIIDYVEFIDHIYVPNKIFYDINLEENEQQIITIIKDQPPKATSLKIKPLNEEFYDIEDIKTYLEVWLKKMFLTLSSGEIITLPYLDKTISLYIDKCEPSDTVSIFEIEEIKIDFLPMDEYLNKKADKERQINQSKVNQEQIIKNSIDTNKDFNKNNLSLKFNSYSNKNSINTNTDESTNITDASNTNESNSFVPFSGKGNRLGSK